MPRLAAVTILAMLSMSGPQTPQDEVAALRKEVEALKAQQTAMQRDLNVIKNFLQVLAQAQQPAEAALVDKTVQVDGVPMKGALNAKVMMVEVSDYHCPFCRRFRQQTQPQIDTQYIETGKIRYAFIDYPIAQLHPDAFRAHEAANCAGEQGKYWEMNSQLFEQPARDVAGPRRAGGEGGSQHVSVQELPRGGQVCGARTGEHLAHAGPRHRQHADVPAWRHAVARPADEDREGRQRRPAVR